VYFRKRSINMKEDYGLKFKGISFPFRFENGKIAKSKRL